MNFRRTKNNEWVNCFQDLPRVIGYYAQNGVVNGRISVVFNRIPFVKLSVQR